MRVLNTAQMREADRRTIEDIGIPSIVLMENAGRQAVAAMEAAFEDLAIEPRRACCAAAATTAATASSSRARWPSAASRRSVFLLGSVADVRGDARINLEVLGRLGLTVVEITNAQAWELHFTEVSECDLVVDAILGTGFRGRLTGLFETVVADVNGSACRSWRSICRPACRPTARGRGRGDRGVDDRHAGRAEDSADLSAGRPHAGDLVIADIGIPPR